MNEDLMIWAIDFAQKLGADYAEVRLQKEKGIGGLLKNGLIEPAVIFDSCGIGIRLLFSGVLTFTATNDLSKDNLRSMIKNSFKKANESSLLVKKKIDFSKEKTNNANWKVEEKKNIEDIGFEDLYGLLKEIDKNLEKGSADVAFSKRILTLNTHLEEKIYMNSDGTMIKNRIPRLSFHCYITTSYEGKIDSLTIPPGYSPLGGTGGWEVVNRLNIYDYVQKEAENLALIVKNEKKPPTETLDLIIGPLVCGLIAHESVGHPQEADRILGREAAQAGESYLKRKDLGLKIGSSEAFISDDPTIPHSYGYYLYDDEGVSSRKRKLIEGGLINEFLHDRTTAHEFDFSSNGSSRANAYDREPIIRMANTYVEPGDYSLEELLEGIKHGVYIKSFMEWNIDDIRYNQRYVGLEAYKIENGELGEIVRNPVLEITTPKFWQSLDARGKDIEFMAAICGKGDPMQGIHVSTGGPSIRLRKIKLGAR